MISYDPLYRTMKARNITTYKLVTQYNVSRSLLDRLKHNRPISTVTLNDLCDSGTEQLSLFHDEKKERARKLDQTVDQLRGKFGVTAISRGSVTDASRRVGRKYKAELDPDKQ